MDKASIANTLSHFSLFSELSPEQVAIIAENSQVQTVARGGSIFNRGDVARGLYILLQGQLKLGVTSPQGAEKVISIISPGESFGEAILFLESQFPVYAQAILDAQVLVVSKSVIFSLIDNDSTVARKMLAGLSQRMHRLVGDIEALSLQSCTHRFIGYLLQISADTPETNSVTLPTSKTTIASLLNLTPETLSRTMTKLQHAGLIEVHGKDITITNVAKLRKFEMEC